MPAPVLPTKLYVPRPRTGAVARPRLLARLEEGPYRKLTVVAAPAGFGKTTLVAAWLAARERTVAWLSLDEADRDPGRLRAYLVAALERACPRADAALLKAAGAASSDEALAALAHEVAVSCGELVLVLDDFHRLGDPAAEATVAFLLDHLPPGARLVLTTREDPALPLARLRARDELTELRADELRFTPAEAADFLRAATGRELDAALVEALEARTEGWAAGLQLAAVSLRGAVDAARFVASFTGSHRFVADYLVEEVLQRQPPEVRAFLLRTSVVERMCGPLCDVLTGDPAGRGRATLQALERADLLLVPLDDERVWYRYHHLLGDVLRLRLHEERPDEVAGLHAAASAWLEAEGHRGDAVEQALASGDVERSAGLVERSWFETHAQHRYETVRDWLDRLPDEVVRDRPGLAIAAGWTELMLGRLESVEPRFAEADAALAAAAESARGPGSASGADAAGASQARGQRVALAAGRAYLAQARGELAATVEHARRVLELDPDGTTPWHGAAATLAGIAAWRSGDLATAERQVAATRAAFLEAGELVDAISVTQVLAEILVAMGRLGAAAEAYRSSSRLAESLEGGAPADAADLYRGYAEVLRERGELDAARRTLRRAREVAARGAVPDWRHRVETSEALLAIARGDLDGALAHLAEAGRAVRRTALPVPRPVAALEARVRLARGTWPEAAAWARSRGLTTADEPAFEREYEQLTLARVRLAQHAAEDDAEGLAATLAYLDRHRAAAEAGGRAGVAIEATMLSALVRDALGDRTAALAALDEALAVAEPEGWTRLFLDEGAPMRRLLDAAAEAGVRPGYVGALRAAAAPVVPGAATGAAAADPATGEPGWPEPLTERELDVLRLIAEGRSNQEIADRLGVALSTVKGYARNLFGKLMVERRTEAVARAREIGLLG